MRRLFLLVSIMTATAANPAIAQMFPRHADICVGGIVSKEKLAKAFVRLQPDWYDLYVKTLESASDRRAVWSAIFTSDDFCKGNPACLAPDPDAKPSKNAPPKINTVAANRSLEYLRIAFRNTLIDETERGRSYAIAQIPPGALLFPGQRQAKCNSVPCQ